MSGKAGSWLNASRDGLAANAGPVFSKLVLSSLARIVKEDLARPNFDGLVAGGRAIFSFFLQSMAHFYKGEWIELAEKLGDSWSDMLSPDGVNTFRDYLNKDEVIIVVGSSEAFSEKNKKLVISLQHAMARLFLAEWVKLPNKSISVVSGHDVGLEEDPFDVYYSLKSVPQVPYSKPGLAWHLLSASRLSFTNSRFILRIQGDEWSSLYLRENVDVQASEIFDYVPRVGGRVLLPFLYRANNNTYNGSIEVTSLDELCAWIKPRLINDLSISEIRERYDRLINYIDNEIMRKSRYRKEWAVCRGITVGASKANRAAA
jgi:hypothetical protein